MKKLLIILGAVALTFTLATAEEKCAPGKCDAGKCGQGTKVEKKCDSGKQEKSGKCNEGKNEKKKVPEKGKCGQGKCG